MAKWLNVLAEREGFEPPLPLQVNLISSQAPSTGLGHLSAYDLTRDLGRIPILLPEREKKTAQDPSTLIFQGSARYL